MSWLFKSLQSNQPQSSPSSPNQQHSPTHGGGGVKHDFSVIGESIGLQLRGVANFLAPPPSTTTTTADEPSDSSSSPTLVGIRNDLAEIGGSLKSGLSLLSSNKAVCEISKFTSSFLPFQNSNYNDDDDADYDCGYVPGITDEVIDFVKSISTRPECWTDFPLSLQNDDFRMCDAQREHASTVEGMVPSLGALRAKLSGAEMGDDQFWMIYFILLLPRLNDHDFEILSTPQIVETRNVLLPKLQNKRYEKVESSEKFNSLDTSREGVKGGEIDDEENTDQWIQGQSIPSREKVTEIVNATAGLEIDEENTDQWLEDTNIDTTTSVGSQKKLENEEDVSFSDLEDEDNDLSTRLSASRQARGIRAPSPSGSSDWVQLHESSDAQGGLQRARQSISRDKDSDGESNDWLKVDDFDYTIWWHNA